MENVLLNQSLFGFDRGQVLKYIDDMSAHMSRQAREYAKKQTDLQEEIEKLSADCVRLLPRKRNWKHKIL